MIALILFPYRFFKLWNIQTSLKAIYLLLLLLLLLLFYIKS